ncbi:MAG: c-type cytochrome biogenesis protein CcsB [Dehalococcoidia bacterium]
MWYYAFYAGLIATLGALVFQLVRLGAMAMMRRTVAATSAGSVTLATTGEAPPWAGRLATFLTWVAVVCLSLSLLFRVIATGRPPYSNMWEFLVAFGWVGLLTYALFSRRYPHPAIGAAALLLVTALLVVPEVLFSSAISPLVPALQNNRLLGIHVALLLLAYGVLGIAFAAAVLYLVQAHGRRLAALPSLDTLDDLGYRAVIVGFPLLAAGVALGAYWGNIAWGRYWGWDPKETTALVTWLMFAGYLHARGLARWRGKRAAWLIVLGFAVIIFNIFAVNFWIAGLHSYAGA